LPIRTHKNTKNELKFYRGTQRPPFPQTGVTKHRTARTAYTARTALLAHANGG